MEGFSVDSGNTSYAFISQELNWVNAEVSFMELNTLYNKQRHHGRKQKEFEPFKTVYKYIFLNWKYFRLNKN